MKKIPKIFSLRVLATIALIFSMTFMAVAPATVFASGNGNNTQGGDGENTCGEDENSGTGKTSFTWGNNDDCTTANDIISTVFRLLSSLVAIAVVGGIAWGAFLYSSSSGEPAKAQQGISYVVNSVIGLLFFIILYALSNWLVPGGISLL